MVEYYLERELNSLEYTRKIKQKRKGALLILWEYHSLYQGARLVKKGFFSVWVCIYLIQGECLVCTGPGTG